MTIKERHFEVFCVTSLRGTKTTDRRELINTYKKQIININNPPTLQGDLLSRSASWGLLRASQ